MFKNIFKQSNATPPALGPLETQILDLVWQMGEVSVRDLVAKFDEALAYTTIMTTLDRLHKKGMLTRRKEGRAFFYSARYSPEELERTIARDFIDSLLGRGQDGVEPVLACIVEAVSEHDRALLDDLDRLIQEKRSHLERKE